MEKDLLIFMKLANEILKLIKKLNSKLVYQDCPECVLLEPICANELSEKSPFSNL